MNLFFYGTLRAEQVRSAVLGAHAALLQLEPATLSGYEVRRVDGALYPMICPASDDADALVEGLVVRHPSEAVIALLDRFEGVHYHRKIVDINVASGSKKAEIYCPDDSLIPAEIWVFEDWMKTAMDDFFADEFSKDGVQPPRAG